MFGLTYPELAIIAAVVLMIIWIINSGKSNVKNVEMKPSSQITPLPTPTGMNDAMALVKKVSDLNKEAATYNIDEAIIELRAAITVLENLKAKTTTNPVPVQLSAKVIE